MLAVPLMAAVFPVKESTGIVLPMLISADCIAVIYYRYDADWKILLPLLPFSLGGIVGGFFLMDCIGNDQLRPLVGLIVLAMLSLNFLLKRNLQSTLVSGRWIWSGAIGLAGGLVSMISNAAGPLLTLYCYLFELDKKKFIGCTAWYFFIINLLKVPFSTELGLIHWKTLQLNLMLFPLIFAGAYGGYKLVHVLPQKVFEGMMQGLIILSAGYLLL